MAPQLEPTTLLAVASNGALHMHPNADSTQHVSSPDCRPARLSHARLDRLLARFARRPERFAQDALCLGTNLDARGIDLEVSDPAAWRARQADARVAVESQLAFDVDGLRILDREEELRLVLRIEFARIRLERARGRQGADGEEASKSAPTAREVERRLEEWHALRLELVERNLYLVAINVRRYRHVPAERADLMQAASAALFRAVDGFDWRRGVLFRTYAVHWLNQAFRSYLYNFSSTIRVPAYLQKSIKHLKDALEQLGDPHASVDDLVRATGMQRRVVQSARRVVRNVRSLDAPLDRGDGALTLASELALRDDAGPDYVGLGDLSLESGIEVALGRLNARERRVVEMRFGIGCERAHIYAEVADELGVSLERVRQILKRAIAKMRAPSVRKVLEPLVG
jgi:RNA polymerase sigma factor (sigma-70 family)